MVRRIRKPVSAWQKASKAVKAETLKAANALYGADGADTAPKVKPKPKRKPKKVSDPNNPLERDEQRIVVVYSQKRKLPYYAVPNAAKRTMWEAMHAKRDGLQGGIPDLVYPVGLHGYHGLYIEMKRRHGAVISPKQRYWHRLLAILGYRMEVCHGADAALAVLGDYFKDWSPSPEILALNAAEDEKTNANITVSQCGADST